MTSAQFTLKEPSEISDNFGSAKDKTLAADPNLERSIQFTKAYKRGSTPYPKFYGEA